MKKNLKKILYILAIMSLALLMVSCKKKPRHKWMEVGADPNPPKVEPGVHPERGSDSNAVPVVLAPVLYPTGRDKNGVAQYKKYFYELDELTPENIDVALKGIGLIDEASLFCDLVIEDVDTEDSQSAGPGAVGQKLNKKGIVRYVDLSTSIDNSDEYEGKVYPKDLAGMIDQNDIEYCITQTFEENFQLVSCDIEPVDMDEYRRVHNNK